MLNCLRLKGFAITSKVVTVVMLAASGCSTTSGKEPVAERLGTYRVTVETGGETISSPQSLVHRISLTTRDVELLNRIPKGAAKFPFSSQPIFDLRGGVKGLKVSNVRSGGDVQFLGLQNNDLITAIGTRHVQKDADLHSLISELNKNKQASLTLERRGRPHKILYYVETPSAS